MALWDVDSGTRVPSNDADMSLKGQALARELRPRPGAALRPERGFAFVYGADVLSGSRQWIATTASYVFDPSGRGGAWLTDGIYTTAGAAAPARADTVFAEPGHKTALRRSDDRDQSPDPIEPRL